MAFRFLFDVDSARRESKAYATGMDTLAYSIIENIDEAQIGDF